MIVKLVPCDKPSDCWNLDDEFLKLLGVVVYVFT